MTRPSIELSNGEILGRLMTRRDIARIGAAGVLVVTPMLLIHDAPFNALGVTFKEHVQAIQGAGHVMGTHRMGSDPNTSVTDADGRTHDHPNLFLAGGGLFPTIGSTNPTLTIAALALRTAATIETDLGVVPGTPAASPLA